MQTDIYTSPASEKEQEEQTGRNSKHKPTSEAGSKQGDPSVP